MSSSDCACRRGVVDVANVCRQGRKDMKALSKESNKDDIQALINKRLSQSGRQRPTRGTVSREVRRDAGVTRLPTL